MIHNHEKQFTKSKFRLIIQIEKLNCGILENAATKKLDTHCVFQYRYIINTKKYNINVNVDYLNVDNHNFLRQQKKEN